MDGLKDILSRLRRSLLPVNPAAGRLRALLALLGTFIFWTINAQNLSSNLGSQIRFSSDGFIANVLGEMLRRYFHPATLGLTFTPILLFLAARQSIIALFSKKGWLDKKRIARFLDRCAFSTRNKNQTHKNPELTTQSVSILGGPFDISNAPRKTFLLQSVFHPRFVLAKQPIGKQDTPSLLQHGQILLGMIDEADLTIPLQIRETWKIVMISVDIPQPEVNDPDYTLTYNDAALLLTAGKDPDIVKRFIRAEVERFYRMQKKEEDFQPDNQEKQDKPRLSHDNYAQHSTIINTWTKGFSRPHKRSQYSFTSQANLSDQQRIADGAMEELPALKEHLQDAMVSFFNLSQITISNK